MNSLSGRFSRVGDRMKLGVGAACAIVLWLAGAPAANAQSNSIESVTSAQQGSTTYLRINMKSPPGAVPAGFSIANPPRIALDLVDTANATGRAAVEMAQGDVRSVAIVQSGERSRVVLNLKRPLSYSTSIDGSTLVVALEPIATGIAAAPAPSAYSFPKAEAGGAQSLREVDFRRGRDGEGRVVVDLSSSGIGVDVRQQGSTIVVDFLNTTLPDNLRRKLDVGDFGTPIRSVRAFQQGANARLVIEPSGLWEHNAYQSDTQFVVEVKGLREDPARLGQGSQPRYRGDRLSLNFQDIEVRALLQVIADFTNLNIVSSDSVAGNLTLRLKDVPWDQALDIILQSKGLDMRRNGNVIMVAPSDELAAREKLDLEARQQIAAIEPVRTETFQLNYQKAEQVQKLLGNEKQRVLSKRGSVVIDQRTNKVFVQDTVSQLEAVRKVIEQIDVPVRQVLIEARIVEADDRFSRNLGVRFGYNRVNASVGSGLGSVGGNLQGVADLTPLPTALTPGTTALANTNFVNLPAAAIAGLQPSSFAVSLFNSTLTRFLNLEISALEADQRGKVLSSPRVLTADQGTAIIEQGKEIPYQEATSSGATAVQFKKAVLKLEVTPQITPEGSVIMTVKVSRDNAAELLPSGVAIDTRRVETQVLVENGGTVVIGGIYEQVERDRVNKVPFLGDLPFVGYAFKNNERVNDRNELLVFLTPRVLTDTSMAR
jgi:type IV pilus assembly protein PilQ